MKAMAWMRLQQAGFPASAVQDLQIPQPWGLSRLLSAPQPDLQLQPSWQESGPAHPAEQGSGARQQEHEMDAQQHHGPGDHAAAGYRYSPGHAADIG